MDSFLWDLLKIWFLNIFFTTIVWMLAYWVITETNRVHWELLVFVWRFLQSWFLLNFFNIFILHYLSQWRFFILSSTKSQNGVKLVTLRWYRVRFFFANHYIDTLKFFFMIERLFFHIFSNIFNHLAFLWKKILFKKIFIAFIIFEFVHLKIFVTIFKFDI